MSNMLAITITTGNANLASSSSATYAHVILADGKEVPLYKFIKDNPQFASGTPLYSQSVRGSSESVGGRIVVCNANLPSGTMIKITNSRKLSNMRVPLAAAQIIRLRDGAAVRDLKALSINHSDIAFQELNTTGSFDILSLENAEARGYKPNEKMRNVFSAERVSFCFRDSVVKAQEFEEVVIKSDEGEVTTANIKRRRRKSR